MAVVKARKEDNQDYLSVKSRRKTQWPPLQTSFFFKDGPLTVI